MNFSERISGCSSFLTYLTSPHREKSSKGHSFSFFQKESEKRNEERFGLWLCARFSRTYLSSNSKNAEFRIFPYGKFCFFLGLFKKEAPLFDTSNDPISIGATIEDDDPEGIESPAPAFSRPSRGKKISLPSFPEAYKGGRTFKNLIFGI